MSMIDLWPDIGPQKKKNLTMGKSGERRKMWWRGVSTVMCDDLEKCNIKGVDYLARYKIKIDRAI